MLVNEICQVIHDEGGTPYFVGGSVRDQILGLSPKDFDVEVFDMQPTKLKRILEQYGSICEVGESFGVIKLRTPEGEVDFSTPRRENKAGEGHKGFIAELDPTMTVAEAASRRDFTINSVYRNAITGEIHDYFDGQLHLQQRLLVAVSHHFVEDPLRVLRGMQFASRFNMGMKWTGSTTTMAGAMAKEYKSLPVERIGEEWRKWGKGNHPANGLHVLWQCAWEHLYPALTDMRYVPQDSQWHPEGTVEAHVQYVCNAMANICQREGITGEDREVLMFAALCHDMGKSVTTVFERERWRSPGHAQAGVPIARQFLKSIGIFEKVIVRVLPLVQEHMFPTWEPQTRRTVRRLKIRLEPSSLEELMLLMEADTSGRPPYPPGKPDGHEELVRLAEELPPKIEPLVGGLDIINNSPTRLIGPEIGKVKNAVFNAQLDEEFSTREEGIAWMIKYVEREGFGGQHQNRS